MTNDWTLYGWDADREDPRWVPVGSYATEADADAQTRIPFWMRYYSAFKIDHTVYRFGELT